MIRQLPSARAVLLIAAALVSAAAVTAVIAGTRSAAGKTAPTVSTATEAVCPAEPGCMDRPECAPSKAAVSDACCSAPQDAAAKSAAAGSEGASGAAAVPGASPAIAGMMIALDPESGQYGMPSPEQIAELSAADKQAVSHSGEGLVEVRHPDGFVSIDLQGRFQEYSVAKIDVDGKPQIGCGNDPAAALRALDAPAAASTSTPAPAAIEER